jgi:hypothetical protein
MLFSLVRAARASENSITPPIVRGKVTTTAGQGANRQTRLDRKRSPRALLTQGSVQMSSCVPQQVEWYAPVSGVAGSRGGDALADVHHHAGDGAAVALLEGRGVALLERTGIDRRCDWLWRRHVRRRFTLAVRRHIVGPARPIFSLHDNNLVVNRTTQIPQNPCH